MFTCTTGYYTRSGYVPGPICKYNWTKVWSVADGKSKYSLPQVSNQKSYLYNNIYKMLVGFMVLAYVEYTGNYWE